MLTESLIKIFKRDLSALKVEIESYKTETNLWIVDNNMSNSSGNLCLHLIGNLNHFIGGVLGNTGYIRQRELEFSLKDVPRDTLIAQIAETEMIVVSTLESLTEDIFEKNYPIEVFKDPMTTEFFLIHLTTHLRYHLGQINYHRRLLDK
ncbi:DUF1572 family protein [Seonamhaeicola marinus]|uniref:DinB family protein n=1 Tax=Seonamhaeicola marinus TaxID=1912246 RepID=A0A5D0HK07_9FLAO|nr:DUF1572 family protein [Seonamhaeicola marinus]TYA71636.1 DinB family protein [Seonamhaeicola marinus]